MSTVGDPREQNAGDAKIVVRVMLAHIPASLLLWWLEFSAMRPEVQGGLEGVAMMALLFALAAAAAVVAVIASGFTKGRRWAAIGAAIVFFSIGVISVIGFVNHLSWFGSGRDFVSPRLLVGYGIFSITGLGMFIYSLAWILAHRTES